MTTQILFVLLKPFLNIQQINEYEPQLDGCDCFSNTDDSNWHRWYCCQYEKVFKSKKLLYQWKKSSESIVAEMFYVLVDPQTAVLKLISFLYDQKQFSSGVLMKRCSENVQQIYKRTPMSNCDFNKIAGNIIEIKFRHGYL